ncbi:hypothetical protein DFH28DRAFT_1079862 [Melampsora americana]|nr:hypothetical protein DFH28DRAFT_1079862 [Melampsora americana]
MPTQPKPTTTGYDRSFSLTSRPTTSASILPHHQPNSSKQGLPHQRSSVVIPSSSTHQPSTSISRGKSPIVYPALLSKVAEAFKSRTVLSERTKDGLTYTACFDGRAAVDKIAYIIKTTDRNLALLLGRALDAQKFFHDVTYDHRLRDSPNELYQFRARLGSPFTSLEDVLDGKPTSAVEKNQHQEGEEDFEDEEEMRLPSGVFTLLTDCYSPTCTRDRLCYSIACPRRLEQQARLNLKPKPGLLKRTLSTESLIDLKEPGTLWIHSVPQEVIDSVDDTEKKRQEAINECIYTERDFVRDLEYLRDSWIKPLQTSSIIPEQRRQDFVTQVFWNVLDVLAVNSRLSELLTKRQKSSHVIKSIGDLYLELVPHFGPFVQYGSHQLYGKYEFEKEKISNPAFGKFVDETERLPESRKLELNAYLTKPTTRLARYPLLLEVVLKYTPEDNSDKTDLPKVIKLIRELLTKVNIESGKSENRFNLAQLDQQLVFRQGEAVDLRLREEGRELIFKGQLKKRGGGGSDSAELQVYLFDHALLMVKQKYSHKTEQLKVYRKPIPLELLTITGLVNQQPPSHQDSNQSTSLTKKSLMNRASVTGGGGSKSSNHSSISNVMAVKDKAGYPITINHLGRKGYSIVLWAPSFQSRSKWLEKIEARQIELRNRSTVFEMVALNEGFFVGNNKVTCAASFENGNRYVFGTDNGVYLSSIPNQPNISEDGMMKPIRVIQIMNVTQVEVIEPERILIILADKAMMSFWLDSLDPNDSIGIGKRTRKISSNASFFKVGECLGKKLICVVKSGTVSSTIKTLEILRGFGPGAHSNGNGIGVSGLGLGLGYGKGVGKSGLRKIVGGNSNDALKVYKEFYIPTESSSVHFLKSKLCVGCNKGFEIVDLESLDTQALLDPADSCLEFVLSKSGNIGGSGGGGGGNGGGGNGVGMGGGGSGNVKPLGIFRVEGGGGEFLLCYEDFGFYVNKNGWRARNNWIVYWEGHPVAFAIHYPFVLAFEPSFVEVRHLESGALLQIIPGPNIRHLFSDKNQIVFAAEGRILDLRVCQSYWRSTSYHHQQQQQHSHSHSQYHHHHPPQH